jgi:DNA-binding transcriptional ArsR family regulator
MAIDQDNVSSILSVLSHSLRREILLILSDRGECTFTDLLNTLEVDTGKLSFHLRTLSAFMEQTPTGKYKLSRTGESAVRIVKDVESWAEVSDINRKVAKLPPSLLQEKVLCVSHRLFPHTSDYAIVCATRILPSSRGKHVHPKPQRGAIHNYRASLGLLHPARRLQRTKHRKKHNRLESSADRRKETILRSCGCQKFRQNVPPTL